MTAPGKLHIGFVFPGLGSGGAERVGLTLASSLIERGHRIDLVGARVRGVYRAGIPQGVRLYHPRLPGLDRKLLRHRLRRSIEVNALTINPMGLAWAWHNLRWKYPGVRVGWNQAVFAWVIARYIRRARPQLLMSAPGHSNIPAILGATELANRSVPVVVSEHSNVVLGYTGDWLPEARALYPKAEAVVAVSKGVSGQCRAVLGINAERVYTIHNPIPCDAIWRAAQEEMVSPPPPPSLPTANRRSF